MRQHQPIDDTAIRCTECKYEVDEFTAIAEGWRYYSDGCGDLMPFCPGRDNIGSGNRRPRD